MTIIQPRHDRVLVKRLPEPETSGKIIIPDVARQKGIKGEIVAVGPGKWVPGEWWYFDTESIPLDLTRDQSWGWTWIHSYFQPTEVHPGQLCYFNSRWNDDEQIPSEYHLIQEADIFAVIP